MSDKLREQVRQLLALADDPGASASEREVGLKRAAILMARHAITSLNVEEADREDIEVREFVVDGGPSTPSLATLTAIADVAKAADLFTYYTDYRSVRGRPHILARVAGFRSDLEWFMPLIATLTAYVATGWGAWRRANAGRYQRSKTAHRRQLRDGFITGFGAGVAVAIRDARADRALRTGTANLYRGSLSDEERRALALAHAVAGKAEMSYKRRGGWPRTVARPLL